MSPKTRARFNAKWRPDESGCWIWTAGRQHAYGAFRAPGVATTRAHRISWLLHRGEIPEGLHVLHRCDVPLCVNPDHLWLGTGDDNVADREAKGRGGAARGDRHGFRLHPEAVPRGERSGTAKLTERDVLALRAAHADGERISVLAQRLGVSWRGAWLAATGRTWAHVGQVYSPKP